jgi:hypothetical protein
VLEAVNNDVSTELLRRFVQPALLKLVQRVCRIAREGRAGNAQSRAKFPRGSTFSSAGIDCNGSRHVVGGGVGGSQKLRKIVDGDDAPSVC